MERLAAAPARPTVASNNVVALMADNLDNHSFDLWRTDAPWVVGKMGD